MPLDRLIFINLQTTGLPVEQIKEESRGIILWPTGVVSRRAGRNTIGKINI
jgi:hypothetical protein